VTTRAQQIQAVLRATALRQSGPLQAAFAAIAASEVRMITALNAEIAALGQVVADHFGRYRDGEVYLSEPGPEDVCRVLAESVAGVTRRTLGV
jgi:hypothetical protein